MPRSFPSPALALAFCLAFAPPGLAQDHDHHAHDAGDVAAAGAVGPAAEAYAAANAKMHADMQVALTGDPDVDFVQGMIPHHQGAIDMAKIVIAHGKDPAVRKLAEDVIKAQEQEIAFMREWLAKQGK